MGRVVSVSVSRFPYHPRYRKHSNSSRKTVPAYVHMSQYRSLASPSSRHDTHSNRRGKIYVHMPVSAPRFADHSPSVPIPISEVRQGLHIFTPKLRNRFTRRSNELSGRRITNQTDWFQIVALGVPRHSPENGSGLGHDSMFSSVPPAPAV